MRIGILTLHAQQNYGGVLQCFALKCALESMGHEVVVIDRWLDARNLYLRGLLAARNPKVWLRVLFRMMLGCGDGCSLLRSWRSIKFVKSLGLTKYHFIEWKDAPKELGVDLIVVGSDQVWHCGDWGNPRPYLLEDAPNVKAISYAASFGIKDIPAKYRGVYKRGLPRFSEVSCREKEGVEICRRLGVEAMHVVDPTLLVDKSAWSSLVGFRIEKSDVQKKLVCYFMAVNVDNILPALEKFAQKNNCLVDVLTITPYLKPSPKSFKELIANYRNSHPHVKVASGYGPREFVEAFSSATWTLTDSFHAVMFSYIFGKELRFIRPQTDDRRVMFARIEEFAELCISGPVFVDSVQEALDSYEDGATISFGHYRVELLRATSREWLIKAVGR